jgi:cytoskeletal protein CcmA (bactofilin family)
MHEPVEFRGFLGEGSSLEGDLRLEGPFRIDGRVAGRILATEVLVVGPPGRVEATTLSAEGLIVGGWVEGELVSARKLEILPGGAVVGRVRLGQPGLIVHPGGRMDGDVDVVGAGPVEGAAEPA